MTEENYAKNYRILGIPPGASWKQLRQAYKKLINVWHPDRFQQDIRQRKLAEDKTKEITQSYKELAEYHKKFGVLPLTVEEEKQPVVESHTERSDTAQDPAVGVKGTDTAVTAASASILNYRMSKPRARIIAATVLLGSVYIIWQIAPWGQQDTPRSKADHGDQAAHDHNNVDSTSASPDEKRFTFGSSLGDVYAIQGIPTRTENDIWHYGNSKVYFSHGRVARWEESTDSPLRADIARSIEKPNPTHFGRGSSKQEVLAAQGAPDRDFGSVWDYGLSRVYFEKDRVTGWQESPINPLKVR